VFGDVLAEDAVEERRASRSRCVRSAAGVPMSRRSASIACRTAATRSRSRSWSSGTHSSTWVPLLAAVGALLGAQVPELRDRLPEPLLVHPVVPDERLGDPCAVARADNDLMRVAGEPPGDVEVVDIGPARRLVRGDRVITLPVELTVPQAGEVVRVVRRRRHDEDGARVRTLVRRSERGTRPRLARPANVPVHDLAALVADVPPPGRVRETTPDRSRVTRGSSRRRSTAGSPTHRGRGRPWSRPYLAVNTPAARPDAPPPTATP